MYFFPIKVSNQQERIDRKQEELKLYQNIIEESLSFLSAKIEESRGKQLLVKDMNEAVGSIVRQTLDEEQEFYENDFHDKLKTPPYVYVKRLER